MSASPPQSPAAGRGALFGGLFLATLATLMLEVLDSRLLSVITWYHLAFLAVSLAMLGMASGAVFVFLSGPRLEGERARRALAAWGFALAVAIPVTHVLNLYIPIPLLESVSAFEVGAIALAVLVLTIPFFVSGVVVTLALTRVGREIGALYAFDLLGASLGCLLVIPLLRFADLTSATFATGAVAAGAAVCFARLAPGPWARPAAVACGALALAAVLNEAGGGAIGVVHSKSKRLDGDSVQLEHWNTYSYVIARPPRTGAPYYWGPGKGSDRFEVESTQVLIDGEAGTAITRWDGDPKALDWVQYDVTSLPYHLRRGDALVIGVGGGRDLLSALWGGSAVTGVEVNRSLVEILGGSHREYARLADHPDVTLVNDEARSYLTRTPAAYDVLQMSLIDTWAATGAGAFTLSENGLYTREAWRTFLDRVAPEGLFSVSRWFARQDVSETSRLLALGVASLLDRGVADPSQSLVLVARNVVATLLVAPDGFSPEDLQRIREVAGRFEFTVVAAPGLKPWSPLLARIVASRSHEELEAATRHPHYDYTAPTDERPYFFNILKPASFARFAELGGGENPFGVGGVVSGNIRATTTLVVLFLVAAALVVAIILVPLLRSGLPELGPAAALPAIVYFAGIGAGFMLIQVSFLQRFSVYLGHPTYTFSVILFSMILFAGLGSAVSDRLRVEAGAAPWAIPAGAAAAVAALMGIAPAALDATVASGLFARCATVVVLTAPVSFLLGFCFPFGIRLVARFSRRATAWMWGVNGATGVLASVAAVAISMWSGIYTSLVVAAVLYLAVAGSAWRLARLGS